MTMQISCVQFCCDAPKTSQIGYAAMGFVKIKVIWYARTRSPGISVTRVGARCTRIAVNKKIWLACKGSNTRNVEKATYVSKTLLISIFISVLKKHEQEIVPP